MTGPRPAVGRLATGCRPSDKSAMERWAGIGMSVAVRVIGAGLHRWGEAGGGLAPNGGAGVARAGRRELGGAPR